MLTPHSCFLKLYDGSSRITLDELESMLAEEAKFKQRFPCVLDSKSVFLIYIPDNPIKTNKEKKK